MKNFFKKIADSFKSILRYYTVFYRFNYLEDYRSKHYLSKRRAMKKAKILIDILNCEEVRIYRVTRDKIKFYDCKTGKFTGEIEYEYG